MDEADAPIFAETLAPEVLHFGETKPQATICSWCGQELAASDLDACPGCGALLKPADSALEVPGVTTLDPEVLRLLAVAEEKRRRKARGRFRSAPPVVPPVAAALAADPEAMGEALRRPDAEVLRVMRELEAAARLAEAPAVLPEAPAELPEAPADAEAPADEAATEPEPPPA